MAEAPGKEEDRLGTQLVGPSGQRLRESLDRIGIDLDEDCWKINAVNCHSGQTPTDRQVEQCRPTVLRAIRELDPATIVLLGERAVKSVIGHLWKSDVGAIGRWVGWRIPSRKPNAWICPTWHPSYLLRQKSPVTDVLFDEHLEAAFHSLGPPWGEPPDWIRDVRVIHDKTMAVEAIREAAKSAVGPVAFDYETNALKPEADGAEIVCCSVAYRTGEDGVKAIAYPFTGPAREATAEILFSDIPKVAANLKFEERWTKKVFGRGVRNWHWDTMVASHVLDNRPGITGLKFQSFVRFGQPEYNAKVAPYLKADGGMTRNRIHMVNGDDLLLYNGMDSLLELRLAESQRREMGIES